MKNPESKANVLVVGSGGREHALAWKLLQSPLTSQLYVAPGNGGTEPHNLGIEANDLSGLSQFAKNHGCFTVVGPEVPISLGIADHFVENELEIFCPTKEQARLETSKSFAKKFMAENGIPTPDFQVFSDSESAQEYAGKKDGQVVVKADGLAAGKGVYVCSSAEESRNIIRAILDQRLFGDSGQKLVIEEKLIGREISFFAISDGRSAIPFATATDHKRLLDDNQGPNTGGMGAYSPALDFGPTETKEVMERIVKPTVQKTGFRGFLFLGLMLTEKGPKVLEFNCRLGDPETQAILPRLRSDLLPTLQQSALIGGLAQSESLLEFSSEFACCVVMCSAGYPSGPEVGKVIRGLENSDRKKSLLIFHSGTRFENDGFVTSGGRVLGVTGLGRTLEEASQNAYVGVASIEWEGEQHRRDIGKRVVHKIPKIFSGAIE